MGLDMYMLSYPRYKKEDIEPKIIMDWLFKMVDATYDFNGEIPDYTDWLIPVPFSRECYEFYASKYIPKDKRPDEWKYELTNGMYNEVQYWRKAYTLFDFLNQYYDNIEEDACSREFKKEDIIALQTYITDRLSESIQMKSGQIIGCVDSENKNHFFKDIQSLIVRDLESEDTFEIPFSQPLYTELPIEYLANDDWELRRLLEAKEFCQKTLKTFDFENNVLVYYASY